MKTIHALAVGALLCAGASGVQAQSIDLASAAKTLHNTKLEAVAFKGKKGVKVTISDETARRAEAAAARRAVAKKATKKAGPGGGEAGRVDCLVILDELDFANGTIEADIAGSPGEGAQGGARGFVGLAFRLQGDNKTYDTFYLRPTNGRADDQERRNHSAQYISHPNWPWFRLRSETPSKYETYVDIAPDEWIHVKIEVDGEKARLYVNNAQQPTLIVNDVKSGPNAKGKVALWIEGSTVAHFANLKVTPK
jgi:hypothetical protein